MQNVVVADHHSFAVSQAFASQPTYDGVTLRGNRGGDHVSLRGGTITTDRVWDFDGLPAHLTSSVSISDPGSLTIVPGSVIKMGTGITLGADTGPLKAIGTAAEPILFTATTDDTVGGDSNADGDATAPSPGHWSTFFLRNGDTELAHAELRYGGRDARYGPIWIGENDSGSDGSHVSLTGVTVTAATNRAVDVTGGNPTLEAFRSIGNPGIAINVSSGAGITATDSDFLGGSRGVQLANNASATVSGSMFVGQSEFGVFNAGNDPVAAVFTGNYWAHPGGPHDPSGADGFVNDNPSGTPVTDFVDYGAFLTVPPRPIGPRATSLQRLAPIAPPEHHRYEADNSPFDESGTRNGTLVGDPGYDVGRMGGSSFLLDGEGDYVNLGNWAPTEEWTLAAWVNPTTIPDTSTESVGIVGTQAEFRDWKIAIFDGNWVAFANGQTIDSGVAAVTNVWTHVAATFRDNVVYLYIDGTERASLDIGGPYSLSTAGVRIGSTTYNNTGFFTGRIDEVSIIERSASDAEIVALRDTGTIDLGPSRDRLFVTFDSPIVADSVEVSDFTLSGPSAGAVASVTPVSDRTVEVVLDGELANPGSYNLSVGPQILGFAGIAMDQDQDGTAGEAADDVFIGSFVVDKAGPRIVSQLPDGTTSSVLTSVTVTFNEPIEPGTFTRESVLLLDPESKTLIDAYDPAEIIDGFSVRAVKASTSFSGLSGALTVLGDPSRHAAEDSENVPVIDYGTGGNFALNRTEPLNAPPADYFVLDATAIITIPTAGKWTFAAASDDGYRLEIGDFSGEYTTGRGIATDLHVFDFPTAGDYPLRMVMYEQSGGSGFELSAAVGELAAFDPALFKLVGDVEGLAVKTHPVQPTPSIATLGVEPVDATNTTFRLFFPPQPIDGDYELRIQPVAEDTSGNLHDQNANGVGGEATDVYISTITVDRQPLRIVAQSPSETQVGALESLEVVFNVPIDEGSFSTGDVRITGPAGRVPATSIDRINDTTYRIDVARSTADGIYDIIVGPGIADVGGTLMDSDGDAIAGEVEDRYESTLTVSGAGPFVTAFAPDTIVPAPLSSVNVTFSEPVDLATFTVDDVALAGPDGVIPITGITYDGTLTYTLAFEPQTTAGTYTISVGPDLADAGGTAMDQDQDGVAGEAIEDVFTTTFNLDSGGPIVVDYTPDFVSRPYSFIDVTFNEELDLNTFSVDDVSIIGPDGVISVNQVIGRDMNVVRVTFPTQSTLGEYTFTIGADILDPTGNAMDQDGDGIFGEIDEDRFVATVTFAAPDLKLDSITAGDVASNGDVVNVQWTVENLGAATSVNPWTDRVVLSGDDIYGNFDDVELGRFTRDDDLAVAGSYVASLDVEIPFGIDGDYFIIVRTDASNQVFEETDANNTLSRPITIELEDPPADLIVDAISVPSSGFIGDVVDVTWRVRNDGTARTVAESWTDRLYLSSDTDFGSDVFLGDVTHSGALESNASYTMTESFVVPASVTPGNYYVIVQTDRGNQVEEPTAEDNNVTSSSESIDIDVAPLADLVVNTVTPASGASPVSGESVTVLWTTQNVGDEIASTDWTDHVYLSTDEVFSTDDVLLGTRENTTTLAVGETVDASLAVTLPDAISGEYRFIVVPDATDTVREGEGETTGTLASDPVEISLFPYADLTVSQVLAPELLIGDPVDLTVTWTVENVGAGPGRVSSWTDRVVLSSDDVLGDGDDIVLGEFVHDGSVPVGESYDRTEIFQLANRTNGRFTLFVQTDVGDEVFELTGDASNTGSPDHFVDVTRTPYSDLIVDEVTYNGEASSGQPLEVSWTISNRGIETTDRDTWTDYVYISDDPAGAANLRLIGSSVHGGALAVDGSYTRTTEVTIPRDADGEHYLFVRTGGPYEFIYGGFESGNQGRSDVVDVTFIPPPPTNLRVTEVSLGGLTEAFDGTQVEVTWTVRNDGPEDPENGFEDRLYLQSTGSSERYEFGRFGTSDPLPAGMTVTRTELVTLPRTTGQFRFFVDADSRDVVIETDESDNTTFSDPLQINLQPRPDLRVTEVVAPDLITAGTIIDVDFTVSNLGTADTPSGGSRWSDRVYLSSSSSSLSGAILLGEIQNGSALGFAGTTSGQPTDYRSSGSFLIPRALSGNWFVLVVADARRQVDEFPAEGNNMTASAIAIDANPVPPPDLVALSVNGPGDAFDDSSFTVRYSVANRGAGITEPGAWTDQIWLTLGLDGPKPGRGDVFIGTNRHTGVVGSRGILRGGSNGPYSAGFDRAILPDGLCRRLRRSVRGGLCGQRQPRRADRPGRQ